MSTNILKMTHSKLKPRINFLILILNNYGKNSNFSTRILLFWFESNKYPKAFSKRYGPDYRRGESFEYTSQAYKVVSLLEKYVVKKTEIVENTPFDNFETDLALELIDKRLIDLYDLIQNNPLVIRKYVEEPIEPIEDSLSQLHNKVDQLLSKDKKYK